MNIIAKLLRGWAVASSAVLGCWSIVETICVIGHLLIICVCIWLLVDMTKHLKKWRHERENRYGNQNHRQDYQPKSETLQSPRRLCLPLRNQNTDGNLRPLKKRRIAVAGRKMKQLLNLAWVGLARKPISLLLVTGSRYLFRRHPLNSHKSISVCKQPNGQKLSDHEPVRSEEH